MRLGSVQRQKEGLRCAEAIEQEDVFFVTFVLSFVSMIVLCGREGDMHGRKGNMRGRVWASVMIDRRTGG